MMKTLVAAACLAVLAAVSYFFWMEYRVALVREQRELIQQQRAQIKENLEQQSQLLRDKRQQEEQIREDLHKQIINEKRVEVLIGMGNLLMFCSKATREMEAVKNTLWKEGMRTPAQLHVIADECIPLLEKLATTATAELTRLHLFRPQLSEERRREVEEQREMEKQRPR